MLMLSLLLGCPAEMLRVPLPTGGIDALSMEDMQRDMFMLGQGGRLGDVQARMVQMHLLPGFGDQAYQSGPREAPLLCGRRDGRDPNAIVLLAAAEGDGASADAPVAILISLAKAFDTDAPPPKTLVFCVASDAAYRAHPSLPFENTDLYITLGTTTHEPWSRQEDVVEGTPHWHLSSGDPPVDDRMEALDLEGLLDHTRALYAEITQLTD